jgi:hypothetical protein
MYDSIIKLLLSYIEIEKNTNKPKIDQKQNIIDKMKVVLTTNDFINYYYFISNFIELYI